MPSPNEVTHTIQITNLATSEIQFIETTNEELKDLAFWIATVKVAETSVGSVKLLHKLMEKMQETTDAKV
jgi:hypothetical protein